MKQKKMWHRSRMQWEASRGWVNIFGSKMSNKSLETGTKGCSSHPLLRGFYAYFQINCVTSVDFDFLLLEEISKMPWLNWAAGKCDKQRTEAQNEAEFSPHLPSFSELKEDFLTLYGFGLFWSCRIRANCLLGKALSCHTECKVELYNLHYAGNWTSWRDVPLGSLVFDTINLSY